jgi:hypothetical protein
MILPITFLWALNHGRGCRRGNRSCMGVQKRKKGGRKMKRLMGLALCVLLLFGCGGKTFYMVNDPYTKNVYYTEKLDKLTSGAAAFTDAQTGKEVSIQNSEVKKITEEEFKAAVGKK